MKIKAATKSSPPHLAKLRLDFHNPGFFDAKEAMEAHIDPAVAQGARRTNMDDTLTSEPPNIGASSGATGTEGRQMWRCPF